MANELPEFPVDDVTLDLLWDAIHPGPEAERSSVSDALDMISRLGGSDPEAVEELIEDGIHAMRDPLYHEHDALSALITEVRRLRSEAEDADILATALRDLFEFVTAELDPNSAPSVDHYLGWSAADRLNLRAAISRAVERLAG